jgi:class 3 adenylate cyclase
VRDYVVKPFQPSEMGKAIEHALTETRIRRERDELLVKLLQANRSLEARLRELTTLSGIGKSVTALLERDSLLQHVAEAAQFVTGAQACLLRLYDPQSGQLRQQAVIGSLPNGKKPMTDTLPQQAVQTRQAVQTPTATIVPLNVGDKTIGVLEVRNSGSTRPFAQHDIHLLQTLADYAAIAIENARLFSELEATKEREKQMIRNIFERYVPPAVVEQLLSQPQTLALQGQRLPITVLFADVRGFTTLAEQLKAETLFHVLNYHLSIAAEAVVNQGGTLDKFMGDAVMAFFNAPVPHPNYALSAVTAAVESQHMLARKSGTIPLNMRLRFGVGIASGEAMVGNIGTAKLMNYTAIGPTVNRAWRLQETARGGQILIDETTYQAVEASVRAKALGQIEMKGISAAGPVFEVLGLK